MTGTNDEVWSGISPLAIDTVLPHPFGVALVVFLAYQSIQGWWEGVPDRGHRVRRLFSRGSPGTAFALAVAIVLAVGLVDQALPADIDLGELYMLAVIVSAWAIGWRTGLFFAFAGAIIEFAADTVFRPPSASALVGIASWNVLSDIGVFGVLALVTDRLYRERERWIRLDTEQRSLIRILDRELPRPLRAIGWFVRTFEEAVDRASLDAVKAQFGPLRHHTRDANFLVSDLLAVGQLRTGDMHFDPRPVALNALVTEAVVETLYRTRVFPSLSADHPVVLADPDRIRHAVASVIGRYLELSTYEPVTVLTRSSGGEGVVEIGSAAGTLESGDLELTEMLVRGNGGRMLVVTRGFDRGSAVSLYLPRSAAGIEHPASAARTAGNGVTVREG